MIQTRFWNPKELLLPDMGEKGDVVDVPAVFSQLSEVSRPMTRNLVVPCTSANNQMVF